MKYCEKCGAQLDDSATFCSFCGNFVSKDVQNANPQVNPEQERIQQPQSSGGQYVVEKEGKALGVCSIVFAFISSFVGVILGIIGLCTYKTNDSKRLARIGLILSIVMVVLEIIVYITIIPVIVEIFEEMLSSAYPY